MAATNLAKEERRNATTSWSGYLYQGKVGILVALKSIASQAPGANLDDLRLEYKHHEDFCLVNGEMILSMHQVKANAGTKQFTAKGLASSTVMGALGGAAGGVGGKLMGAVANRVGGVYIARQGARAYIGQSGKIAQRMTQYVAAGKLSPYAAKNAWRIPIVGSQRIRMTYESIAYKALGGKRMPWIANKQVPLRISKWRFR